MSEQLIEQLNSVHMTEPNPIELIAELRTVKTIPAITRVVARLLNSCGIFGLQQIGHELARLSVTASNLGRE